MQCICIECTVSHKTDYMQTILLNWESQVLYLHNYVFETVIIKLYYIHNLREKCRANKQRPTVFCFLPSTMTLLHAKL